MSEPRSILFVAAACMLATSGFWVESRAAEPARHYAAVASTSESPAALRVDSLGASVRIRTTSGVMAALRKAAGLSAALSPDSCLDLDGDLICNEVDNCPAVSNSGQEDADLDLIGDACDNCPGVLNGDQKNTDGDAFGDACDSDDDDDGIPDATDKCPTVSNPGQEDGDVDLIGDACDNCPSVSNADQQDSDGDRIGDICDACPLDSSNSPDGDAVCNDVDNCRSVANPGQEDGDIDLVGDACDNCPSVFNPDQADWNNDGKGNACEPTPVGSPVTIQPLANMTISFPGVTTEGTTTVITSPSGPPTSADFDVFPFGAPLFYRISTTGVNFSTPVRICITYSDSLITPAQESALRLRHYIPATDTWDDITISPYPDIVANVICGETNNFSFFALMKTCCTGTTGNTDGSADDVADISDVFAVVDYLGASIPLSGCPQENDVNKDGPVDISDLFAIIDYLSGAAALPMCQ